MPKHSNHICFILQVKGFLCLAGFWQRSRVCQHKNFCHTVFSVNGGAQGPLGISLCFLFWNLFFSLVFPRNLLDFSSVSFSWSVSLCVSPGAPFSVSASFFIPKNLFSCVSFLGAVGHSFAMLVCLSQCWNWLQLALPHGSPCNSKTHKICWVCPALCCGPFYLTKTFP